MPKPFPVSLHVSLFPFGYSSSSWSPTKIKVPARWKANLPSSKSAAIITVIWLLQNGWIRTCNVLPDLYTILLLILIRYWKKILPSGPNWQLSNNSVMSNWNPRTEYCTNRSNNCPIQDLLLLFPMILLGPNLTMNLVTYSTIHLPQVQMLEMSKYQVISLSQPPPLCHQATSICRQSRPIQPAKKHWMMSINGHFRVDMHYPMPLQRRRKEVAE